MLIATQLTGFGAGGSSLTPAAFGVWLDPSDLTTMFTERTGASATTQASIDGPVGTVRNKGTIGGYWTSPDNDSKRPTLRSSGGKFWLECDATNDALNGDATILAYLKNRSRAIISVGVKFAANPTVQHVIFTWTVNGASNARAGIYAGVTSNKFSAIGRRLDADGSGTVTGTANVGTTNHVVTGYYLWESKTASLYVDGVSDASNTNWQTVGTTSNTNSALASVGDANVTPSAPFGGNLYQAIADADYAADNRGYIEAFITGKM
jgi:hypothetical protein